MYFYQEVYFIVQSSSLDALFLKIILSSLHLSLFRFYVKRNAVLPEERRVMPEERRVMSRGTPFLCCGERIPEDLADLPRISFGAQVCSRCAGSGDIFVIREVLVRGRHCCPPWEPGQNRTATLQEILDQQRYWTVCYISKVSWHIWSKRARHKISLG